MFKDRLNLFFKIIVGGTSRPIRHISDYMYRIEIQARGSPHAHCLLWMTDSLKLGVDSDESVAKYIEQYQSCTLPAESSEN